MVTTKIIARITNKLLALSRTGGGLLVRKRPTRCGCGTDSAVFLQYAVARLSSPLGIASMSAQVKLRRIFELPPNNGKGAADRKRLPSAAKPLRATSGRSLSVLWKNSQMVGSRSRTADPETSQDGRGPAARARRRQGQLDCEHHAPPWRLAVAQVPAVNDLLTIAS